MDNVVVAMVGQAIVVNFIVHVVHGAINVGNNVPVVKSVIHKTVNAIAMLVI